MARFDVYRDPDGNGYLLDIQAPLLSHLNTRVVVPLLPLNDAPAPARRLNPEFQIGADKVAMVTQFMATVPCAILAVAVGNLEHRRTDIVGALDILIAGV